MASTSTTMKHKMIPKQPLQAPRRDLEHGISPSVKSYNHYPIRPDAIDLELKKKLKEPVEFSSDAAASPFLDSRILEEKRAAKEAARHV